jgi:hypothetical protein
MRPLTPRVTALAPPESAASNTAVLPLIIDSVTQQLRKRDMRSSKAWILAVLGLEGGIGRGDAPVLRGSGASIPVVLGTWGCGLPAEAGPIPCRRRASSRLVVAPRPGSGNRRVPLSKSDERD